MWDIKEAEDYFYMETAHAEISEIVLAETNSCALYKKDIFFSKTDLVVARVMRKIDYGSGRNLLQGAA